MGRQLAISVQPAHLQNLEEVGSTLGCAWEKCTKQACGCYPSLACYMLDVTQTVHVHNIYTASHTHPGDKAKRHRVAGDTETPEPGSALQCRSSITATTRICTHHGASSLSGSQMPGCMWWSIVGCCGRPGGMRSVLILRGGNTGPLSSWNSFRLSAQAAGCQQPVCTVWFKRTSEPAKDMRTNELVDDAAAIAARKHRAAGPCVRAHRLGARLAANVAGEAHLLGANLRNPDRAAFAGCSCSANKLTLRVRRLLRGETSSCAHSTTVEHAAEDTLRQSVKEMHQTLKCTFDWTRLASSRSTSPRHSLAALEQASASCRSMPLSTPSSSW